MDDLDLTNDGGKYSHGYFTDPNVHFPNYPILLEDLDVFHIPDGLGFRFQGGKLPITFRGRDAEKTLEYLLAALDGTKTYLEILEERPNTIGYDTISKTLQLLHNKGLLADAGKDNNYDGPKDYVLDRQLLFWGRNLGLTGYLESSGDVQSQISHTHLLVFGTAIFAAATYDVLSRSGFTRISMLTWDDDGQLLAALRNGPFPPHRGLALETTCLETASSSLRQLAANADLVVTATRNAPTKLFRTINRVCLEERVPLLLANDNSGEFEIGPYIQPYRSACYECLELRRSSVSESALDTHLYHEYLARKRRSGNTLPKGESLNVALLAANLVALEVLRVTTAIAPPTLVNTTMTISPLLGDYTKNKILRVPLCPACYPGSQFV